MIFSSFKTRGVSVNTLAQTVMSKTDGLDEYFFLVQDLIVFWGSEGTSPEYNRLCFVIEVAIGKDTSASIVTLSLLDIAIATNGVKT